MTNPNLVVCILQAEQQLGGPALVRKLDYGANNPPSAPSADQGPVSDGEHARSTRQHGRLSANPTRAVGPMSQVRCKSAAGLSQKNKGP